jgi:fructosamine-3-kinase
MAIGEVDISWQVLRRIVQDWAGTSAELAEVKPLVGGCINTTLALMLQDGQKAVLKISPHRVDKAYAHEAYQLQILREAGLPTPEVYQWKIGSLDDPFSYILLEYVEGTNLSDAKHQCTPEQFDALQANLAELISSLHDKTSGEYRRLQDGVVGGPSWSTFYREVYDPIWHECEKSPHLPKSCRKQIGKVHEKLDRLIAHGDCPRLVHWDIWGTNVLAKADSNGNWYITAILDPNCKYAHAEAEIAYMELFHTITPAFMKVYQQRHKLPSEYHRFRKPIYQLYPLINHLRLFGHDYAKPLAAAVEKTMAIV